MFKNTFNTFRKVAVSRGGAIPKMLNTTVTAATSKVANGNKTYGNLAKFFTLSSVAATAGFALAENKQIKAATQLEPISTETYDRKLTKPSNKKTVAVIGGGIVGHKVAYDLQDEFRVVLIDPKDYFEVPMGIPRALNLPQFAERSLIPYKEFLPNAEIIMGYASDFDNKQIAVSEHANQGRLLVEYDYAVVCTGSSYDDDLIKPHLGTIDERKLRISMANKEIINANNVVIVGGGPVGVELSAEIKEVFPEKNISIIQSTDTLLPNSSPKMQRYVTDFLAKKGVSILTNQEILDLSKEEVTLKNKTLPCDLLIECHGIKPNNSLFLRHGKLLLDDKGKVLTETDLRVKDIENVFCAGDITSLNEPKLALWADKHAKIVVSNIRSLAQGHSKLSTYKPNTENKMMVVALGKEAGAVTTPITTLTFPFFVQKIKAKNLFVDKYSEGIRLKK